MKKVLAQGTKYIFGMFGIGILGLLMSLTYQALGRIFPQSFANQMWGLVLFDIAAICWALCFIFASKTVQQYTASGIGFLAAFIGTLGMVAAEVILSGNLINADSQQVGQWLVYGFIGTTALHAALLYLYHFGEPDIREKIDVGIARGEITTEAIRQATAELDQQKQALAVSIKQEIVSQVQRDLNLKPIPADPRMPFLPAQTYEQKSQIPFPTIKDEPTPAPVPFPESNSSSQSGA